MSTGERYIRFFSEIGIGDVGLVGGKNASLGEMYRELVPQGVRVPNGFAITAQAYWHVLERAGAMSALHAYRQTNGRVRQRTRLQRMRSCARHSSLMPGLGMFHGSQSR